MEFTDVVRARRMVRRFDPDREVDPQVLARALEHAVRAPSAGFSQGWDFVVLTSPASRARFWQAAAGDRLAAPDAWLRGVSAAPVLVLCCSDPAAYLHRYAEPDKGRSDRDPDRWPVAYWDVDTGMAALLLLLTATDCGLGGLFFGVPSPALPGVHAAFGLREAQRIVGVVALGHPLPDPRGRRPRRRRRRPLREVVHEGRLGGGPPPWA